VLTATRQEVIHIRESQWFKSMYTIHGKPDTYDTYTFCTSPRMPLVCFLRAVPVHGNLLLVVNNVRQSHSSQEKGTPDYIPNTPTDRSTGRHPISPPSQPLKQWRKLSICWWIGYIDLLSPYHQHVINTFNTCSRGPTHQSLIDIDGGTTLEVLAFHITLSALPNRGCSAFPQWPRPVSG
jgi:hypothetical protein